MSQVVEGLVRYGQHNNLMSTTRLMWESTTTAGILMAILLESGATPLTQISDGKPALFHIVIQHTFVKMAILWVSVMSES